MKKTFFQRTYNLNIKLISFGILSFIIKIGINLFIQTIEKIQTYGMQGFLTPVLNKLTTLESYLQPLSFCLIFLPTILIIIELVHRFLKDSLWNYFNSIYQTSIMIRFLRL